MERSRITDSYIVRVEETARGKRIVVLDLKTREKLEFNAWEAFSRHMHLKTNLKLKSSLGMTPTSVSRHQE